MFLNSTKMPEICVSLLHKYPVLFVQVTCPINELRRREKERGDRGVGYSKAMLSMLIPQDTYDITVDNYNFSVDECASKIIKLLNNMDKCTSFKILWEQTQ